MASVLTESKSRKSKKSKPQKTSSKSKKALAQKQEVEKRASEIAKRSVEQAKKRIAEKKEIERQAKAQAQALVEPYMPVNPFSSSEAEAVESEWDDEVQDPSLKGNGHGVDFSFGQTQAPSPLEGAKVWASDIFRQAYEFCQKNDDVAKFKIWKDGNYITLKNWPYSWEQLQKDYGSGIYKVQAYRATNGHIIKQSSECIGNPDPIGTPKADEKSEQPAETFNNQFVMLNFMQKEREAARREADAREERLRREMQERADKERSELERRGDKENQQMQLMLEMFKAQAESTARLAEDRARQTEERARKDLEMYKTMMEETRKSDERHQKQIELLAKKLEEKPKETSFVAQLKELLEVKELIQEMDGGGSSEEDGKESMTDSVVKAFLPMIGKAMSAQGPVPPTIQGPVQRPPIQGVSQEAGGTGLRPVNSRTESGLSRETIRRQAELRRQHAMMEKQAQNPVAPKDVSFQRADIDFSDKPSVPKPVNSPVEAKVVARPVKEVIKNPIDAGPKPVQTEFVDKENKIKDLALPIISDSLMQGLDRISTAHAVLTTLHENGITPQDVCTHWGIEKILQSAKKMGVPEIANPWLEGFFGEIEKLNSQSTSGRHPESGLL